MPGCKYLHHKDADIATQHDNLSYKLQHQEYAAWSSDIKCAKTAQKLCSALKTINCLQVQQQQLTQLLQRSAGTKQENSQLKRTLKKTAQNCQRARAKLADLQRSHGESDALRSKCDDLLGMVAQLSDAVKVAKESATQSDICLDLARNDIGALSSLTQRLESSVDQHRSHSQQFQQQLQDSEARNSVLRKANQQVKAHMASFWTRTFVLQRTVAASQRDTAHLRQQLSDANAAATTAQVANSNLQEQLAASKQEAGALRQQVSQVSTAAAEASAKNSSLQTALAGSESKVAELVQQLSGKQHAPVKVSQTKW